MAGVDKLFNYVDFWVDDTFGWMPAMGAGGAQCGRLFVTRHHTTKRGCLETLCTSVNLCVSLNISFHKEPQRRH